MSDSIYLKSLSQKYDELKNRAISIIENSENIDIKSFIDDIPKKLIDSNNRVKIVFCGQYSAGKSSIIKQMTGDESIAIAEGVTTDKATVYEWEGIEIVDTPGIQTGKHEDHDEISYRYIAKADLLIYVVTNELFDDILGKDFRRLAIENEKANEMLLVVNKMERHKDGNSKTAQKIIKTDIEKILVPYTPDELNISFISTEIAMEADTIKNVDEKNEYLEESGYPTYYKNLDTFISQKGMIGQLTTNISTLSHTIHEILSISIDFTPEEEAIDLLLMEKKRRVRDSSNQVKIQCNNAIKNSSFEVKQLGNKASALVEDSHNSDDANRELLALQEQVNKISKSLQIAIENM